MTIMLTVIFDRIENFQFLVIWELVFGPQSKFSRNFFQKQQISSNLCSKKDLSILRWYDWLVKYDASPRHPKRLDRVAKNTFITDSVGVFQFQRWLQLPSRVQIWSGHVTGHVTSRCSFFVYRLHTRQLMTTGRPDRVTYNNGFD